MSIETFISYARKDGLTHAEYLERALPNTWRDKSDIEPTEDFTHEIMRAIEECKWVILCVTQDTRRKGSFVSNEIVYAKLYKKPIIVVRFHDVIPHISIVNNTWIDHFKLGWDATLNEIRRVMALPPQASSEPLPTPTHSATRTRVTRITSDDPAKNRAQLIARVRHGWIEGILYPTLDDARQVLKIGVAPKSDAVLNHEGYTYTIDPEATIETIFTDISERRLLILGDPGAGKTVLLLQLAESLLAQAERSPSARVPVVFNLASWAQARKPIIEWVDDELSRFYDVRARKALGRWMKNDKLIFLFDGLDEVKEEARAACLDALNDFQEQSNPPMVVCSRVTDYESLPQKLNLKSAILLAPLSQDEVDAFLSADSLTRLKKLTENDAVVREMSRNPFLLNTMAYAYDNDNPESAVDMSKPRDPAERREHLFEAYIRRRFFDESPNQSYHYDLDDTLRYLRFLAKNMQVYSQTIFRPELMDKRWLGEALPAWMEERSDFSDWMIAVLFASLIWFIFGLSMGAAWWAVLLLMLLGPIASITTMVIWGDDFPSRPSLPRTLALVGLAVGAFIGPILLGGTFWQGFLLFMALFSVIGLGLLLNSWEWFGKGFNRLSDTLQVLIAPILQRSWIAFHLRRQKHIPFNLQALIDFTIALKVMRAYGGGFVFAHRYLRETLAGLDGAAGLAKRAARDDDALVQLVEMTEQTPEILVSLLKSVDDKVRFGAAQALGKIGDARAVESLIIALKDADKDVRDSAADALVRIGTPAVEPLIAVLKDKDWGVRRNATELLAKIGAPAVEPLIAALKDEDKNLRGSAAETLGKIGIPAVEPLIAALKDADKDVRDSATEALGTIGDARAVEPLIAALKGTDNWVRSSAAWALGKIGDARAVEPLISTLKDADAGVRHRAAWALGNIGDARAVEPLIAALKDSDEVVRGSVAEALGIIGDVRGVESLIAALKDVYEWRRRNAAETLGKISWIPQTQAQEILYTFAKQDWSTLVSIGEHAVPTLIDALKDMDWDVRRRAVEALGEIGTPAVEPLIVTLKDEDEDVYVRGGAAEALGNIRDTRAVEPLIAVLNDADKYVRSNAAEALGKISDARAVQPLAHLLDDKAEAGLFFSSRTISSYAQQALEDIGTPEALAALEEWRKDQRGE